MNKEVNAWKESVIIPTYPVGKPEKNPMFLEKRVYQGSSGVVYPHPVIEKISDEKIDKTYTAVFLENEYIRLMILPELGGRIQTAYDKIKQRHFIYHNQVIKPALVGLTGPWISGGIEFNWPQHHRPSTFEPVDFSIQENEDGSVTVWVNEVERMFRTKGMAGITLYPGRAYIEIKGKIYNRTPFPQTFLWWANPAVKVNDHYQSIFPPDVHAVFDHGKRDVSAFPIAKGVYYKVDYSPGTDISCYKNLPVPTSFMAVNSTFNFVGGYEHDTQAGLLHVADHHLSPGKKQWTWGNGEFGQAWDKNLTDEDGPYIELMAGVFTDNQPDFSWLQPYEEKTFEQYFLPYQQVGAVKNASKEAVINVEYKEQEIDLKLYFTSIREQVQVEITQGSDVLHSESLFASPANPFLKKILTNKKIESDKIKVSVIDLLLNKELISYQQELSINKEIPKPARAAKPPAEVENNEQLYLTGLHLEQYRHATYLPTDYYEEALRRDGRDVRCNNAMGLWFLRRGKFKKAEKYLRSAIDTLTERNPNPYEGEPYYNLGWSLTLQGRFDEAFEAFYKSTWNDAWQHAGFLNLSRLATRKGDFEAALSFVEKSIVRNYHSQVARHLKSVLLRKLGREKQASSFIEESLQFDPFNLGCLFEKYLLFQRSGNLKHAEDTLSSFIELSRNWEHNLIEYSLDYAQAGLYGEASDILLIQNGSDPYPMILYYLGWFASQSNQQEKAIEYFGKASLLDSSYCFPNRIEDVMVLEKAIELHPTDAKAPYYLGNFWYDKRQYADAVANWELSVQIHDKFPTVHRNLALAYCNKLNDPKKALASLEKAFSLDQQDARVLMELDQLHKKLNASPAERLSRLEEHLHLVNQRDDLYLERIALCNLLKRYDEARVQLSLRKFHPWEGGEGKVVSQYLIAHLELAKRAIERGEYQEAIELLDEAQVYPDNLGEGKLFGAQENDIFFLKALALEKVGNRKEAEYFFRKTTEGISEPFQAIFYNDPQPDKIFYQGLAWQKLGERQKAESIFRRLIAFGEEHIKDKITIDYFAVSLPDLLVFDVDLNLRNKIHCLYLEGLGCLGLGNGNLDQAAELFDEVLKLDNNHQGAVVHKQMINYGRLVDQV